MRYSLLFRCPRQWSGTIYNLSYEEKEINEWTIRSRKEGICGIVKCFNKPTTLKNALTLDCSSVRNMGYNDNK